MFPVGETDVYLVPQPPGVDVGLTIDLAQIGRYQQRLTEVATVNKYRAAELQRALNDGWLTARNHVARLHYVRLRAEAAARDAHARAKIRADGPMELRRAQADLDPEFQKFDRMAQEVRLVEEVLTDQATQFRDGYFAAKTIAAMGTPTPAIPVADSEPKQLTSAQIFGRPATK